MLGKDIVDDNIAFGRSALTPKSIMNIQVLSNKPV